MNLDELQIKISIELDDLNKQLKTLTKDIDKALGPKATKKLMADNNKIIKNGLTAINKTTLNLVKKSRKDTTKEIDAMSKDINKSLTKAFDINLTKFNSNITSAMNQARQTVKSACNDIRRELNAALNINGTIRVAGKASVSGSATGSSSSSVASIASSEYIGAMIIKATNAVIKDNRTNAKRIESKIDKATSKIVSAVKNIKVTVKLDSDKIKINIPEIKIPDVKIESANDDSKVIDHLNKLGKINHEGFKLISKSIGQATSKIISVIKSNGSTNNGGIEIDYLAPSCMSLKKAYPKLLGTGSYGSNQLSGSPINFTQGGTSPLDTNQIEAMKKVHELMKQIRSLGKEIPSDTTSFTYGEVITPQKLGLPIEQLKKAKEIIEDVSYRVLDLETGLMNTSNFDLFGLGKLDTSQVEAMKKAFKDMQNIRKQSRMPALNEPIEDYEASEFAAKELHRQVASLMDMAQELDEAFHKTPMGIDEAVQQANFLEGALDAVLDASKDLTSLSPQIAKGFEFARDVLNQMAPGIRALANEIRSYTKPQAPAGIPMDLEEYDLNPPKPETPKIVEDIRKEMQDAKDEMQDVKDKIQDVKDEMQEMLKALSSYKDIEIGSEELSEFRNQVEDLMKSCKSLKIDMESLEVDVDDEDLEDAERKLKGYQHVLVQVKKDLERIAKNPKSISNIDTDIYERMVHNPPINIADSGDGDTLGFLPYKNQIDELVEYAKKAGRKIKKALFGKSGNGSNELAMTIDPGDGNKLIEKVKKIKSEIKGIFKSTGTNLFGDFGKSFDSHVAIYQYEEKIKKELGEIKSSYKKAANEIKKTAKQITEPFKKIASVLKSITGGIKSAWNKITSTFKKGAGEASKATRKLRVELKDTLGLALEFVSLYSLVNLGKEAITQSQTLAQSEAKLTSLMRQRMGATNDTVKAIKDLVREQAQLGVVSETAMTRGAEQLSFYLHSAKALETLMPAIANLTAKRGGFNATEDDA